MGPNESGTGQVMRVKAQDSTGKEVGNLTTGTVHPNYPNIEAFSVHVHPDHRRRGLATAMYQHAEANSGKVFVRSKRQINGRMIDDRSDAGRALWAQKGRPFGKYEQTAQNGLQVASNHGTPKEPDAGVDFQRSEYKDKIKGGLADKKKPSDFDRKALKQGTSVEREHTSKPGIAREIAMDQWKKSMRARMAKSELIKSPYGPSGMGLYNQNDNARRKMGRTSDTVNVGPNKAVHSTKPSASQQATSIAAEARRKSKANPVKVYTQAEIAKLFRGGFKRPKMLKSELEKGVNQRLFPFKPTDVPSSQRSDLGVWQHQGKLEDYENMEEGKDAAREYREQLHSLTGPGRQRMLNRLSAKTKVKRHPETGENMYLIFRGMDDDERVKSLKEHHVESGHRQNTSWTPDYHVARGFASDYTGAGHEPVAAWIPERHILTMPKMVGKQSAPNYSDDGDFLESFDRKGPSKFSNENEVIVAHDHKSPRATIGEVKAHRGEPTADVHNMINVRNKGTTPASKLADALRRKYLKRPKAV
jgi:GNAT superfamily N-acetyltransferase